MGDFIFRKVVDHALVTLAAYVNAATRCEIHYSNSWSDGFQAMIYNFPDRKIDNGWKLDVLFSHPVNSLNVYNAKGMWGSPFGFLYHIHNEDWNKEVWSQVNVDMVGTYSGPCIPIAGECPRVLKAWFQGVPCDHV